MECFASYDQLVALHGLIVSLERRWSLPHPEAGEFHIYEPSPPYEFFPGLNEAEPHVRERTFLDVGCGIGSKLVVMALLGYKVRGIEIQQQYVAAARELCPEADIVHADLFSVDDFSAGLVYLNRVAVSDELERAVEQHVTERMSPGDTLLLPYPAILDTKHGFTRVSSQVWVK